MTRELDGSEADTVRPGEQAVTLPDRADAGLWFIGRVRTPWHARTECPRQGDPLHGPVCTLEVAPRWQPALEGLAGRERLQILYWMDGARRDLVLQRPRGADGLRGTFSLRSPVRPNPIASSEVALVGLAAGCVLVRGLDCLDGTPLLDIKPVLCPMPVR